MIFLSIVFVGSNQANRIFLHGNVSFPQLLQGPNERNVTFKCRYIGFVVLTVNCNGRESSFPFSRARVDVDVILGIINTK